MCMRIWLTALLLVIIPQAANAQSSKPLPMTPFEKTLQEFTSWRSIIGKCRNDYDSSGAYRVALSTIQGATDACGWLDNRITQNTSTCREKVNIAKQKAGPLIEVLKTKILSPLSTSVTDDQKREACLEAVALVSQEVTGGASSVMASRRASTPDASLGGQKAKVSILMGSKRRNTK